MKKKIYLKMALVLIFVIRLKKRHYLIWFCLMLKRWQIVVRMAIRLGQLLGQLHVIISKVRGILPA